MQKHLLLAELEELLNIPQIERIIFHKLKEMKSIMADEIQLYKRLKHELKNEAYGELQVVEKDSRATGAQPYLFELDRHEDGRWVLANLEPQPPVEYDPRDIVPMPLIDFMTSFKTHAAKIQTVSDFSHHSLKGRLFHLRFARFSEFHLMGTVTELERAGESSANEDNIVQISDLYKKKSNDLKNREIAFYMDKYPAFRQHVFSMFYMKWKPVLDKQLVDLS